jgi:hypothetical protein
MYISIWVDCFELPLCPENRLFQVPWEDREGLHLVHLADITNVGFGHKASDVAFEHDFLRKHQIVGRDPNRGGHDAVPNDLNPILNEEDVLAGAIFDPVSTTVLPRDHEVPMGAKVESLFAAEVTVKECLRSLVCLGRLLRTAYPVP